MKQVLYLPVALEHLDADMCMLLFCPELCGLLFVCLIEAFQHSYLDQNRGCLWFGRRSGCKAVDSQIYKQKFERPPIETPQQDDGLSPSGNTAVSHRHDYTVSDGPVGFDVALTEFLNGDNPYIRADGRNLFDEVGAARGQKGDTYYKPSKLNQTA